MKNRRWERPLKVCIFLIGIILCICYIWKSGYRLSSEAAVRTIRFSDGTIPEIILSKKITSDLEFYLVDTGEYYHTVFCKKKLLGWQAAVGTSGQKKSQDRVELLNQYWDTEYQVGWMVVLSHDPDVSKFEITCGDQIIVQKAEFNALTVIVIQPTKASPANMNEEFDALALSKSDEILYELGYPIKDHIAYAYDYQWFPIR